ncbi:putative bifunctional diguanylate cyclase/phosphodiesterase [Nitratireductor basaltis]|uniref:putative bifunctional diguanylate cyclase/phosphodiesterase n=1 Tax=Nitratireductor basaltis TaxID=472175 RepID=UPI000565DCE7|nr:EAL domain-containing protein [Nitratireductor basaltis]
MFRYLKGGLIATTLAFAVAAGYLSLLIFQQQKPLSHVSRYDVAWSASQGVNEFIRLYQRITAFQNMRTQERIEDIQLRYEILKGRVNVFESGFFADFTAGESFREDVIVRVAKAVEEMEGLVADLDEPGHASAIMALMAPLEPDLIRLSSEAAYFTSVKISEYEQDLLQVHRTFMATALGFILFGLALAAVLAFQNRTLAKTQSRLTDANKDLKRAATDLAHMARHDLLTGLPNRRLLREFLEDGVIEGDRVAQDTTVMCLDLDDFKHVNDTLGHPVGDALLQEVASRIKKSVDDKGIIARLGGDEFIVVLKDLDVEASSVLAEELIESISWPYMIDGHDVAIGVSVGLAQTKSNEADWDTLLSSADSALYSAKAAGRGSYRFFEPEMDVRLQRKRLLELALRTADYEKDFALHYQPIVNLNSKKITTMEVLLRWPHTPLGNVPPDEFIPLAEQTGVIVSLGAWLLKKACKTASRLPSSVNIAVNVSAVQFQRSDIVDTVTKVLRETGLEPHRLELEVTETLLLEENSDVHRALRKLRALGIRVSLDDFGTGYSSLAYLRKFTFDKIKIDRSFLTDMESNPAHRAIIDAIIGLTDALGVVSVAEGVETWDQLQLVGDSGCDEAQGYLFSKPVPESEMLRLFGNRTWTQRVA